MAMTQIIIRRDGGFCSEKEGVTSEKSALGVAC